MMHGIDLLHKKQRTHFTMFIPLCRYMASKGSWVLKDSRLGYAAFMFGWPARRYNHLLAWPITCWCKRLADEHWRQNRLLPFLLFRLLLNGPYCFTAFAHGALLSFMLPTCSYSRTLQVMELRATDDRFVIAIDAKGSTPHEDITKILKEAGAVEVKHNDRKYVSYE